MSNDTTPRVHGVPQPKGTTWLKEVKVDAAKNAVEHLRRQAETREFEDAKARGITPEEIIEKGKQDIARVDQNYAQDFGVEPDQVEAADDAEQVEELKKRLKAERAARTKAENKLKAQEDAKPVDGAETPDQPESTNEEAK